MAAVDAGWSHGQHAARAGHQNPKVQNSYYVLTCGQERTRLPHSATRRGLGAGQSVGREAVSCTVRCISQVYRTRFWRIWREIAHFCTVLVVYRATKEACKISQRCTPRVQVFCKVEELKNSSWRIRRQQVQNATNASTCYPLLRPVRLVILTAYCIPLFCVWFEQNSKRVIRLERIPQKETSV